MSQQDELARKLSDWHEDWCEQNENRDPFHIDSWKYVAAALQADEAQP
ncbi:hypothetical protein [Paenarthrobacter sp. JL.01a]|nr:hypothetical protein [Paenarthrobacter sp. JL.01a]UXM92526.1 hypothetical protein N5P29_04150 [Paenarthrobacter sp. JL.01a]